MVKRKEWQTMYFKRKIYNKLIEWKEKYSKNVHNLYLMSQNDIGKEENLMFKPFYLMPFLIDE